MTSIDKLVFVLLRSLLPPLVAQRIPPLVLSPQPPLSTSSSLPSAKSSARSRRTRHGQRRRSRPTTPSTDLNLELDFKTTPNRSPNVSSLPSRLRQPSTTYHLLHPPSNIFSHRSPPRLPLPLDSLLPSQRRSTSLTSRIRSGSAGSSGAGSGEGRG